MSMNVEGQEGNMGLLVCTGGPRAPDEVDLFMISHEEASISNNITSENNVDISHLSDHVEMRPVEVVIEGKLLPSTYGGNKGVSKGDDIKDLNEKAHKKLRKIVQFCNDVRPGTHYSFHAPALPVTYERMFPVDFSYNNEGETNTIDFTLTLEEIGMRNKLKRGDASSSISPYLSTKLKQLKDFRPKNKSRYHASIAASTEDGGGQVERGIPSIRDIDEVMDVESLEERVENRRSEVTPKQSSKIELINKELGAVEELSKRASVMSFLGSPDLSVAESFGNTVIDGDIGSALNQELGGVTFPSTSSLTSKKLDNKDILANIPNIGPILDQIKQLPNTTEFLLEANAQNESTILFTMRSSVMRKVRRYILQSASTSQPGVTNQIINNTILNNHQNRLVRQAFIDGVDNLRKRAKEREGLSSFITSLPSVSSEDSITYYNYLGQPVMSFEGIVELEFDRWATQFIDLNEEEYEVQTYWNKAGFPVFSIQQTDGTQIVRQTRAFLGVDLLSSAQFVPNLKGVHIIPFAISDDNTIKREKIGESIHFMVVHTNNGSIRGVL